MYLCVHCKKVHTTFLGFFSHIVEYDIFLITFGHAVCSRMTLRIPVRFQFFVSNECFDTHVKIYRPRRAPSRPNCRGCRGVWIPDGLWWALGHFCSGGSDAVPECNRLAWPPRGPERRTHYSWWCPPKVKIQNAKLNGHRFIVLSIVRV